jgi:hypothetical protein
MGIHKEPMVTAAIGILGLGGCCCEIDGIAEDTVAAEIVSLVAFVLGLRRFAQLAL